MTAKKIKPVAVNARTTLILRNIPSAANEADVKALLTDDKCPKVRGGLHSLFHIQNECAY